MASTRETREAREVFETLAARHGERRGRILLVSSIALIVTIIVVVSVIDEARTNSAKQYASATQWVTKASESCDRALGLRRMWLGGTITSSSLCIHHTSEEERLDEEDPYPHDDFSFLVIGDWGRNGMCCQHDVAVEMSFLAKYTNPSFIVSAGDNFYVNGISSPSDPQVDTSWRNVYIRPYTFLQVPWNIIAGNHDYEGDVSAQISLSKSDKLWSMPDRYYFKTFANDQLFIAFLDTTCMYYNATELSHFNDDVGVSSEYCDKQVEQLDTELQNTKAKAKLVIGHHPFLSGSSDARLEQEEQTRLRERLKPICIKYGVLAYISGHEHLLEHYVDNGFHSFISGAGSKVRTVSMRRPESVFSLGSHGFLQVALRNDSSLLHFRFFDFAGAVVHSVFLPTS